MVSKLKILSKKISKKIKEKKIGSKVKSGLKTAIDRYENRKAKYFPKGYKHAIVEEIKARRARKLIKKQKEEEEKKNKGYVEINKPVNKKPGIFTALAGIAAAQRAKNAMSPPTVVFHDPTVVVIGMKPKGVEWVIKYGTRDGRSFSRTGSFTVNRYCKEHTAGGGCSINFANI